MICNSLSFESFALGLNHLPFIQLQLSFNLLTFSSSSNLTHSTSPIIHLGCLPSYILLVNSTNHNNMILNTFLSCFPSRHDVITLVWSIQSSWHVVHQDPNRHGPIFPWLFLPLVTMTKPLESFPYCFHSSWVGENCFFNELILWYLSIRWSTPSLRVFPHATLVFFPWVAKILFPCE